MENLKYIQLEGLEINKNQLERPDVQRELLKQLENRKINLDYFLLGVVTHMYEDTQLPLELDYAFQMKNSEYSEKMKFVIRGCFNYGTKFHTKLWQGYSHLAIIEIDNPNSEILQTLKPYKFRKRWDPVLILCNSQDSVECKNSINSMLKKNEIFMKENNPERWEILKKEEIDYKNEFE
jgi:hypothetical protein